MTRDCFNTSHYKCRVFVIQEQRIATKKQKDIEVLGVPACKRLCGLYHLSIDDIAGDCQKMSSTYYDIVAL